MSRPAAVWKPFIGIGAGLFVLTADSSWNYHATSHKPGFYPRIGVESVHFTASIDYNFVQDVNVSGSGYSHNSYVGMRVGFFIGGGVKKRPKKLIGD